MAKYAGSVGYATQKETSPGVWTQLMTERKMRGDILRISTSYATDGRMNDGKVNDDLKLQHRISVVSDAYSRDNFMNIKYVTYLGTKWKVMSVEVSHPRLILSLGG